MTDHPKVETVGALLDRAVSDAAYQRGHDYMDAASYRESAAWGSCMRVVRGALREAGLLDAPIIPTVCPECGGAGTPPLREAVRVELHAADKPVCPTCHGQRPVVIVTAEAVRAAVIAGCAETAKCRRCTFDAPDCPWSREAVLAALGEALGGPVEVANYVGEFFHDWPDGADPGIVALTVPMEPPLDLKSGDRIALLRAREERGG